MKWEARRARRAASTTSRPPTGSCASRAATARGVYGHTLLWHNQLPGLADRGRRSPRAELRAILRRHIFAVAGHFRGKVRRVGRRQRGVQRRRHPGATRSGTATFGPELRGRWRCAGPARPTRARGCTSTTTTSRGWGPRATPTTRSPSTSAAAACRWTGSASRATSTLQYPFPGGVTENLQRFAALGLDTNLHRGRRAHAAAGDRGEARHAGGLLPRADRRLPRRPQLRDLHALGLHRRPFVGAGRVPRRGRGDAVRRVLPAQAGVGGAAGGARAAGARGGGRPPALPVASTASGSPRPSSARTSCTARAGSRRRSSSRSSTCCSRGGDGLQPAAQRDRLLADERERLDAARSRPSAPAGPDAPLDYRWDGDDNSQVWLAQGGDAARRAADLRRRLERARLHEDQRQRRRAAGR